MAATEPSPAPQTAAPTAAPAALGAEADLALIKRIIPHRYPFLLVDKVRDIVPGQGGVGIKAVTANEPHFPGHFPDAPIMPGVLIVEAMAQTAAVVVGFTVDLIDRNALVYFMNIDNCKFRGMVVPGDQLELHVEIKRGGGKIWKFHGRAMVNGKLCAEADFAAMLDVPKEPADG